MPPFLPAVFRGEVESYHHVWMVILTAEGLKMVGRGPFGVGDVKSHGLFSFVVVGYMAKPGPPWLLVGHQTRSFFSGTYSTLSENNSAYSQFLLRNDLNATRKQVRNTRQAVIVSDGRFALMTFAWKRASGKENGHQAIMEYTSFSA